MIVHSIRLPMLPDALGKSINISGFACLCFTSPPICDRATRVDLFGFYEDCASSVRRFNSGVSLFPKMQARIFRTTFSRAMGR